MKRYRLISQFIVCSFLLFSSLNLFSSHSFGGAINYKYLGNGTQYEFKIDLYVDCATGANPYDAISHIGVYSNSGSYMGSFALPLDQSSPILTMTDNCSGICIRRVSYIDTVSLLFPSNTGYTFAYQRCCFPSNINNISGNSSARGFTLRSDFHYTGTTIANESPAFNNSTIFIARNNQPLSLDLSSTDINRDSLIYTLSPTEDYSNQMNPKPSNPTIGFPTYTPLALGYSHNSPFQSSTAISLNASTGILTGTPTSLGFYLISMETLELRNTSIIGSAKRTFVLAVSPCLTTSIDQYTGNNTTKIFPNPASTELIIDSDKIYDRISITSMQGKTIKEFNESEVHLNIEELNAGMYLLRLESQNQVEIQKVIKQ